MRKITSIVAMCLAFCVAWSCSEKEDIDGVEPEPQVEPEPEPEPEPDPEPEDEEVDGNITVYEAGDVLGPWEEGTLDIHFINTGRGESSFFIFPDGTTLLVDFAGYPQDEYEDFFRPNASVSSEDVIVNYINNFTPEISRGHIDFALATHFHGDHVGVYSSSKTGGGGAFRLIAMTEIGERLPYRHYMDRVYPDYNHYTLTNPGNSMSNIENFVKWTVENNGTVAEWFNPGGLNQIHMVNNPDAYTNFKIQNLTCSGCYWTGEGEEWEMNIPDSYDGYIDDALPNENCYSCAFHLTFGKFDYYAGGDLQYNDYDKYLYKDAEASMIPVVGEMDVNKANHHGCNYANSEGFLRATNPTVWIANLWTPAQPGKMTVNLVHDTLPDCDMYATNTTNNTIGTGVFTETQGHIVVRVAPNGKKYYVYMIEDGDFSYKVKSVHAYDCK